MICKQYFYGDESDCKLQNQLNSMHSINRAPICKVIKNGYILPRIESPTAGSWGQGGVLKDDFSFVEESSDKWFGGKYIFDVNEVISTDFDVVYLGFLVPHWGIFLVDFLRRLYYLYDGDKKKKKLKIAFCGIGFDSGTFGGITEKCRSFFRLLDINDDDIIDVRTPMKFNTIYIPENGYEQDKYFFSTFLAPFDYAVKKVRNENSHNGYLGSEKIYLSRTHFKQKKEAGELFFERFFSDNGYLVLYPEELEIEQQIEYFSHARVIASIEGSVAHTILFSNSNTRQIIIRKQHKYLNPRQYLFNEMKDSLVSYIDCYYEPFKHFPINYDIGPFLILFNKNIRAFAKDNGYQYKKTFYIFNIMAAVRYFFLCIWQGALYVLNKKRKENVFSMLLRRWK